MCPRHGAFIAAVLLLLLAPLHALKTSGPSCAVPEAPRFLALPRCPATSKSLEDAKTGASEKCSGYCIIQQASRGSALMSPAAGVAGWRPTRRCRQQALAAGDRPLPPSPERG